MVYNNIAHSVLVEAAILCGFELVYSLTLVEQQHMCTLVVCWLACLYMLGVYSF